MLAGEFGSGQVFWSLFWFTMFVVWVYLLIIVFSDVFRSHDLGGFAKAMWILFVIIAPYLGVFIYFIARGKQMSEHAVEDARTADKMQQAYIRQAAGTPSVGVAGEIERLVDLRDNGVITAAEFDKRKAQLLQN